MRRDRFDRWPERNLAELHPDAYAMRLVWLRGENEIRQYEPVAVRFHTGDEWNGCENALLRAFLFGGAADKRSPYLVEVLDERLETVQDYPLTKKGFEYLKCRILKCRVDWEVSLASRAEAGNE